MLAPESGKQSDQIRRTEARRRRPSRRGRGACARSPTCCPKPAAPPSAASASSSPRSSAAGARSSARATPPSPSPESIRFPPGKKSGGVLTLVVEGAHAPMMQHVAPAIVERVNRFFGYPAVERIAFRQGIVQAEKAKTAAGAAVASADTGRAGRIRCARWSIRSFAPVWNRLRAAFRPAKERRW